MTGRVPRFGAAGLALCAAALSVAACTADEPIGFVDKRVPLGSYQFVAFDSCDEALTQLRAAATDVVGPYGFNSGYGFGMVKGAPIPPAVPGAAPGAVAEDSSGRGAVGGQPNTPNYSGTNTHEAGVDEPDLVKTDGRRIVTLSGGMLRVVDAATQHVIGTLALSEVVDQPADAVRWGGAYDLLLAGDRVLVLMPGNLPGPLVDQAVPQGAEGGAAAPRATTVPTIPGPRLILVDLVGGPHIVSTLRIDGSLVDARQVGSLARVVVRSAPRLEFPAIKDEKKSDSDRIKDNKKVIANADLKTWLPRIEVTNGSQTTTQDIGCDGISRPAVYSGTNLLTVLSLDLSGSLSTVPPLTIVADGETLYSNGPSLYVASDQRWKVRPQLTGAVVPADPTTAIYRFDTSGTGKPTFVAGGAVPGYLINQYAMSEWGGNLRVATTTEANATKGGPQKSESGVHVLATKGSSLSEIGSVGGLGKGERIYAVRFNGSVGYVVTFRQTDPLYAIDLSDPTKPTVKGELKIPGYSAYLHPAGDNRLIGIGQNADTNGRVSGTQVSLFDVGNLSQPSRIATYTLSGGYSEAEFDPHAFLYWPAENLLVVPVQVYQNVGTGVPPVDPPKPDPAGGTNGSTGVGSAPSAGSGVSPQSPLIGALVLRINGSSITQVGFISQPAPPGNGYTPTIRRSLVIDSTLWTVSDFGLLATDLHTLARQAWIPFS